MSLLQLPIAIEKIGPIQGDSTENLIPDSDQENKITTQIHKRQPPKIPKEKRRIRFSAQKHVCYFSQDGPQQSLTFSPVMSPRQKSESLHSILKIKGVAQSWGGIK